jgi:hypothetical protein
MSGTRSNHFGFLCLTIIIGEKASVETQDMTSDYSPSVISLSWTKDQRADAGWIEMKKVPPSNSNDILTGRILFG